MSNIDIDSESLSDNAKDGSTSSLWKHIKTKHNDIYSEISQLTSALNKLEISEPLIFTQESFRNDLVYWIISDEQPFTIVQNLLFQKMIIRLNSEVKIPSADTIHNDIIKIFKDEKEFIKKKLQEIPSKVSITLDAWTSKNQISFLGITIHWITNDWKLENTTLDFSHIEGPHSGENLASKLFEVLKEFELLQKILGISTDNTSNMNKMFSKFESICEYEGIEFIAKNQRIRCLAHIINLAVQNILKTLKEEAPENENEILQENTSTITLGVIAKLRTLIIKIRASSQKKEKFKRQCIALNIKPLELIPDVKTRWNSTHNMIERAIILRECFEKATLEMSSSYFPTLGQTVPIYNYLIDKIEDFLDKETDTKSEDVVNATNNAKNKLQQYYLSSDGLVYIIATKNNENDNQNINQNSLAAHMFKKRKTSYSDELEAYLNEPLANFDMDILAFWKVHENKFPNLSKMARDFLAIPGTSVPVERVFSGGTDLITQSRCSLDPETIRKLMCLKAWIKYKNSN
ncbi:zinc finger BED domain-containing protein RICESLEEPER 2-like [Rhizophagus irregularis DAOM 181602=DAOM 197198]|nr:zinc finger BED domain-containing protein RICESLEEPER 2-like [Rhizophagus irregularis DAOM 181602=DAOM 197198]